MGPLEGILVIAVEQAVAAPFCTSRLCEAGARVIKIERESGDFARGYDNVAGGDSSYFLWLNRNKESLVLDFKDDRDAALLHNLLAQADVFVQNLGPGALERAGFGSEYLRKRHPRLITCDITGYGSNESAARLKAYDFLVQAESGLVSISGGKKEMGRIGVSVCDIGAGMNAHAGILEALIAREKSGAGIGPEVSLFGTAADWMTVPLLHFDYGGETLSQAGLHHPSIAPYGGYQTLDDKTVIIAIQNEREWSRFCNQTLHNPDLAGDARFDSNNNRVKNRAVMDEYILAVFKTLTKNEVLSRLEESDIAYGSVNSICGLSRHVALQRQTGISSQGVEIRFPERPIVRKDADDTLREAGRVPGIGEDSENIRKEFS